MGKCKEVNLTKDEVRNIIEYHNYLFDLQGAQTREQTLVYLDYCNNNLKLKSVTNNPDYKELYELAESIIVPERVSKIANRKFQKKVPNYKDFDTADNTKKAEAGVKIHQILQGTIDYFANKVGDLNEIKKLALSGDYAMTEIGFESIVKGSKDIIQQLNHIQDKINKANNTNEKVVIRVEQKLIDSVKGIAGAEDIVAIFSDNSAAILDYKTVPVYSDKKKYNSLISENKIDTYNATIGEYKRILKERIGVNKVRISRAIPIQIQFEQKSKLTAKTGDILNKKLISVKMGEDLDYLPQIPVAQEATEYTGLNKQLNKQLALVHNLEQKLDSSKLSYEEKQALKLRILSIKQGVRTTIVKGELTGIISDVYSIVSSMRQRMNEPELLTSGEENPDRMTLESAMEFIEELSVYNELIENTHEYLQDFKELDPKAFVTTSAKIDKLVPVITHSLNDLKIFQANQVSEIIPEQFKDEAGNLLPQLGLGTLSRTFLNLSEINHPLFIAFNNLKDSATYDKREQLKKFEQELSEKETNLFKWGASNGLSIQDTYNLLINKKTGDLIPIFTKELYDTKNKALADGDVATLKKLYTHKFESDAKFLENLKERRDRYSRLLKGRLNNLEDSIDTDGEIITTKASFVKQYKRDMDTWEKDNNLLKHSQAWLNTFLYKSHILTVKEEVQSQYMTDEYKYLTNNKELFAFYKFFEEKIKLFRSALGVNYEDMPANFIPNVRKDIIEQLIDNQSLLKPLKEIWESLSVREEDVYIKSTHSSTGELTRQIPKLFLNRFENVSDKSFNLGRVLLLFANMTFEYENNSKIEAMSLALKAMLGNPAANQGGELAQDKFNHPIKGFLDSFALSPDKKTKTFQLLEDMTDYYLYGIRYKESSLLGNYDTTQFFLRLKSYLSLKQLGFAYIPASGAFVVGHANVLLEGKKGVSYESNHLANSYKLQISDRKKMLGISGYFDVYSEDPIEKMLEKQTTRKVDKYLSSRFAFSPLRRVDENLTDVVIGAMIQNWGIDSKGNLKKLNVKGRDTNIKSLLELTKFNSTTGKITIEGITKDAFIAFRTAVKATMQNIIGNMSSEDISRTDLSLGLSFLMQFKTWMPAIIQERVGPIKYDERLQSLRQGRYSAYIGTFKKTNYEIQNDMTLAAYFTKVAIPNISKLALDIATFGLSTKFGLDRVNRDRAERHYIMWKQKIETTQPRLAAKVTFEEFLDMKQRQITAMVNEVRLIIIFATILMYLGGDDPETGKPRYMENRATRLFAKILGKADSELGLITNVGQFADILKNPLPISKLLIDLQSTMRNTFDEARDTLVEENASNDPTPVGYYSSQWLIGGTQMARLFELYKTYEKSPYQ